MTLIGLLVLLIVVGVVLFLINTYLPLDPKIRALINIVVMLVMVLLVLQAFGLLPFLDRPIPQIR